MDLVSPSEFIHLTGLSHRDLCGLLEDGQLVAVVGPQGGLQIDITQLPDHLLAYRATEKRAPVSSEVIAQFDEHIASEILHQLDDIVVEAVDLAATWLSRRRDDAEE